MQAIPNHRCGNSHVARLTCVTVNCKVDSGICQFEYCEFKVLHKDCLMTISTNALYEKLTVKGQQYSYIYEHIANTYDAIIKMARIQKDKCQEYIDTPGLALEGDQLQLYNQLTGRCTKKLEPNLVFRVATSLSEDTFPRTYKTMRLVREESIKWIEQAGKLFHEIESYVNNAQSTVLSKIKTTVGSFKEFFYGAKEPQPTKTNSSVIVVNKDKLNLDVLRQTSYKISSTKKRL